MRFAIEQAVINNIQFPGIQGYQMDRGNKVISDGSDGTVNQTNHLLVQRAPIAQLFSLDLFGMLDPTTGLLKASTKLPLAALDGVNGLAMYGAQGVDGNPSFAGAGLHSLRTALNGVLAMQRLRWSPGQRAILDIGAHIKGTGDGVTPSVVETNNASLPTWTNKAPNYGYGVSALTIGGQAINLVNSLTLEADAKFAHEYSLGLPEPINIRGAGVNGKLAWTMHADIGDLLIGAGTGTCTVTFSQYANEAPGFSGHTVTFVLNGAWALEDTYQGDNNQPMGKQLMVRSLYNGTLEAASWSTT